MTCHDEASEDALTVAIIKVNEKYTIQSSCAMCILHIVLSLTKISPICDVAPVHVFHVIHPRPDPSCITKLHSAIPTHGPSHNE